MGSFPLPFAIYCALLGKGLLSVASRFKCRLSIVVSVSGCRLSIALLLVDFVVGHRSLVADSMCPLVVGYQSSVVQLVSVVDSTVKCLHKYEVGTCAK